MARPSGRVARILGWALIALCRSFVVVGYRQIRQVFPDICGGAAEVTPEAWRRLAQARHRGPDRACLVDDLLASNILLGRKRAEVAALLGPPTDSAPDPGYDLIYYLGPERGPFGIDSQWLLLGFDSAGRLVKQDLHRD